MGHARIQIETVKTEMLRSAIELSLGLRYNCTGCQWYSIDEENGLVFYSHQPKNQLAVKLPFPLDAEGMADFAQRWLPYADYPQEPDTDGSTERGWGLDSGQWGRIADDYSAVLSVKPWWAVYGK